MPPMANIDTAVDQMKVSSEPGISAPSLCRLYDSRSHFLFEEFSRYSVIEDKSCLITLSGVFITPVW